MTIAARFGQIRIVELLLNAGALIDDAADSERIETAVNIAANHGHAAVVDLLMRRGANLSIHYTPAHWAWYAKPQRHQHVIDLVRQHFESLPLICDAGPIETSTDEYSITHVKIKDVPPTRVAFNSTGILNAPQEISAAYGALYEPMDHALAVHQCFPIGPNILAYTYEADGSRKFRLDNCWPISASDTVSGAGIAVKNLPAMRSASVIFRGAWQNFGAAYRVLNESIAQSALKPGRQFRELYHLSVGPGSKDCITEIQKEVVPG